MTVGFAGASTAVPMVGSTMACVAALAMAMTTVPVLALVAMLAAVSVLVRATVSAMI